LNIDKSTQCVLHTEDCHYCKNKKETLLKGIGKLKVDGGWLTFTSAKDARTFFFKELSLRGFKLSEKCRCLKKTGG
jgi:ribosomal protein L24E